MSKIIFRVDASSQLGMGHLRRCVNLANSLKKSNKEIFFICREAVNDSISWLRSKGWNVFSLPKCDAFSWDLDAHETKAVIKGLKSAPELLIVDHYSLDIQWEKALRESVEKILVIDDLADRFHECDYLLDQNLVENHEARYQGLVPARCVQLLGPQFALLQSDYARWHLEARERRSINRILVSFGGTDQFNLTQITIEALIKFGVQSKNIKVDVVLMKNHPRELCIREISEKYPVFKIHDPVDDLGSLMLNADLAIGAPGVTSWERLCLKLPALAIVLADNQVPIAKELSRRNHLIWLGSAKETSEDTILNGLEDYQSKSKEWVSLLVDGRGSDRCASVLTTGINSHLIVRHADQNDELLYLNWTNDPVTRANSLNTEVVSSEQHHKWFQKKLKNNSDTKLYVIQTEQGFPVAQVRFDKQENSWLVSYSIGKEYRNRRLSKKIMKLGLNALYKELMPHKILVQAKVKKENIPSHKVFQVLGFDEKKSEDGSSDYYLTVQENKI